ncbi:MAG: DNA repair protein RecO [Clostridiales bacterium]|jgi:DNA repair protein RecO|nr:DNA repair protein RecO [Clostridiales bacterium]
MGVIKDKGLVLRETAANESNKRLILLTEQNGKLPAFARGALGAKSKLVVGKFSYNEFIIFDGGQFLSLNQVAEIRHFAGITACYESYCAASFMLELADKMVFANMDAKIAVKLILLAFARLNKSRNPKAILAAFIFKFLQKEGFAPLTQSCANCAAENPEFFGNEGLNCANCRQNDAICLNLAAVQALDYILTAEPAKTFNFKASTDVIDILHRCAILFLCANVDIELKSLDFILKL